MGLRFLLDTNAISEPYRPAPAPAFLSRMNKHAGEIAIASVTWFELVSGVAMMPDGKRKQAREGALADIEKVCPVLPYDERAAAWHGREYARLARIGKVPGAADAQIAAIAWACSLTIVTANVKDFRVFEDLRIENWLRART